MRVPALSLRAIARALAEVLSDVPVASSAVALQACARLLERQGLLHRAPRILSLLDEELLRRAGRRRASVVTAEALSPRSRKSLERFLNLLTGEPVVMRMTVRDSILAGFRADVGDLFVDASLRGQLQRLRASLRHPHA